MEARNATLRIGELRAKRMTESDARAILASYGYRDGTVIRHSVARDGRHEMIVTDYYSDEHYGKARLTTTYSI